MADPIIAGVITSIRRDPQDADAVQVSIGDRLTLTLSLDQLVAAALVVGQVVDESRLAQLIGEQQVRAAYRDAIRRLSQRTQSRAELRAWLERRGHAAAAVCAVLQRVVALELIDDMQLAARWVDARSASRDRGPTALRAELRRRGIAPAMIDEVLGTHAMAHDNDAAVLDAARRGATRYAVATNDARTFVRRLSGWLLRRGFAADAVQRAVAQVWRERRGAGELPVEGID